MKVLMSSLIAKGKINSKNYLQDVLSKSNIVGDFVYIPNSHYKAMREKYPSRFVEDIKCKYLTKKIVNKKCCGDVEVMFCLDRQDFTSHSACIECGGKENS